VLRLPHRICSCPRSRNASNRGPWKRLAQTWKVKSEGASSAPCDGNAKRGAVAAALGASVPSLADWFDRVYGVREATLVETCQRLSYNSDGPYQATGTPKSLDHKFITEDVPTGLIPMSALGAPAGVGTPAIDALVGVVRSVTGKDFAAEARTLERLGLSGMDGPQICRVVEQGFS
jgi:opine dehydrogenase